MATNYRGMLKLLVLGGCLVFPGWGAAQMQDDFVIVRAVASNRVINPALTALYQNNLLYVPFEFLTQDLSLAFSYDLQTETIRGWLEQESNEVVIEFRKSSGRVGKQMFPVGPGDFVYYEGELFLSTALVDLMLLSASEFDFNSQVLSMQTAGNLPFEKALSREKKREQFDRGIQERKKAYSRLINQHIYTQKNLLQLPFIDLSARYSVAKYSGQETDRNLGYSANASFLTGEFDSNAYVYSSSNKENPIVSLKTARVDESGRILGLFKQLEAGDIYSFSHAENSSAQSGWGVKLSTDSALHTDGKTYNIRDALPLGWEVELYRNDELLGYRTPSADGFFEFNEIPLLLGKNTFKFVFYGPQGQIREKYETLFFNGNILDKGQTRVKLNYVNKNRYLLELRETPRPSSLGNNALAEIGYGLTDQVTLSLSAMADSLERLAPFPPGTYEREDKTFAGAELSLFSWGIYSSLGSVVDFKQNAATLDYYLQTSLWNWDVTFQNTYFGDAITQRNLTYGTFIKNSMSVLVNKPLHLGWLGNFPFSYSFNYLSATNGAKQTEHAVSLSKNLFYNLYLNAMYQRMDWISGSRLENISFNANQVWGPYTLRGNFLYDLIYAKWQNVEVSAYRDLSDRLKAGAKYTYASRSLQTDQYEKMYALSLNWSTRLGFISLEAGSSNWHNSYAFIGYNLSLLPDSRNRSVYTHASRLQGTGAVSALAFMDANLNGVRDKGEKVLPQADFEVAPRGSPLSMKRHPSSGSTVLTHLPVYRPFEVALDTSHIEETLSLLNTVGSQTVQLRPSQVLHLEFPVVGTGDIEGKVYIKTPDGREEAKGMVLKLYNQATNALVASKISEFDGYYVFQQLPMGSYAVRVDAAQAQELELVQPAEVRVKLSHFEQLEVRDVVLVWAETKKNGNKTGENGVPARPAPTPTEPVEQEPPAKQETEEEPAAVSAPESETPLPPAEPLRPSQTRPVSVRAKAKPMHQRLRQHPQVQRFIKSAKTWARTWENRLRGFLRKRS